MLSTDCVLFQEILLGSKLVFIGGMAEAGGRHRHQGCFRNRCMGCSGPEGAGRYSLPRRGGRRATASERLDEPRSLGQAEETFRGAGVATRAETADILGASSLRIKGTIQVMQPSEVSRWRIMRLSARP